MKRCTWKCTYHLLDYYFSRLSSLLLPGRPVQAKHQNFKEKWVANVKVSCPAVILPFFQGYVYCTSRSAVDNDMEIGVAIHHHQLIS